MNDDPRRLVRDRFVDEANEFGCAETGYTVLKGVYGLPDPDDAGAAMALNGGVAYSGGVCGAISGVALAVGQLAAREISDHREAKRAAREVVQRLMADFQAEFGSTTCRKLIGMDLLEPGAHDRFIDGGLWKTACLSQIEFAVAHLQDLAASTGWNEAAEETDDTWDGP